MSTPETNAIRLRLIQQMLSLPAAQLEAAENFVNQLSPVAWPLPARQLLRGGGYGNASRHCLAACRNNVELSGPAPYIGLRLARSPYASS
jgi:hypothetical protein